MVIGELGNELFFSVGLGDVVNLKEKNDHQWLFVKRLLDVLFLLWTVVPCISDRRKDIKTQGTSTAVQKQEERA